MNLLAIIGVSIIGVALCIVLQQYKPEYAMIAGLASGIVILVLVLREIPQVFSILDRLQQLSGVDREHGVILMKALGICIITQLACDVCADCGQNAIASRLELAGKISVLIVSIPLFSALISIVGNLIGS